MFYQMGKRQFLILISALGICTIFFAMNGYQSVESPIKKKIILNQKEVVIDETQFVFKPMVEQSGDFRTLKILCEITSYMNPEILTLDYENQTMIEINNEIMLPKSWKVMEQSNYKTIGQLIFNLEKDLSLSQFILRIFTFSDHEVIWN